MARRDLLINPPPVTPLRIHHAAFHAVIARVARGEFVNPRGEHNESEISLRDEQHEREQAWAMMLRVFEQEDDRGEPVRHEPGRAHAAQDSLPTHAHEEVITEYEVDECRERGPIAKRQECY